MKPNYLKVKDELIMLKNYIGITPKSLLSNRQDMMKRVDRILSLFEDKPNDQRATEETEINLNKGKTINKQKTKTKSGRILRALNSLVQHLDKYTIVYVILWYIAAIIVDAKTGANIEPFIIMTIIGTFGLALQILFRWMSKDFFLITNQRFYI